MPPFLQATPVVILFTHTQHFEDQTDIQSQRQHQKVPQAEHGFKFNVRNLKPTQNTEQTL